MFKKLIVTVGRVAVSAGLMVLLYNRMPHVTLDELVPEWTNSTIWWLVLAVAFTMVAHVLSTYRWRESARALGIDESVDRFFLHYMAGAFVSIFLPSTIGGDIVRVTRLTRDCGDAARSFASMVFERVSGWIVLPALSIVGLLSSSQLRHLGAATRITLIVSGIVVAALISVGIITAIARPDLNEADGELDRGGIRGALHRFFAAVYSGVDSLQTHRDALWRILGVAFGFQAMLVIAAWCVVQAIDLDVGFRALLAFLPVVLILQLLPLGIGGLGIREGALVVLLSPLGVADHGAVTFGLVIYIITIVTSLVGLPALMFTRFSSPAMRLTKPKAAMSTAEA